MNNENNEMNNMEPTMTPTEVPGTDAPVTPTTSEIPQENPVLEQTPEEAPTIVLGQEQAAAPEEAAPVEPTPAVEAAPVESAPEVVPQPEVTPTVEPAPEMAPTEPVVAPTMEGPAMGEQPVNPEEPKKKNTLLIVIIAVVVLAGIAAGVYFGFLKDEKGDNSGDKDKSGEKQDKTPTEDPSSKEFLELAGKYVDAVKALWTSDGMTCQDALDQTLNKIPSQLSDTDSYSGPAYYYVFINTADATEMKLNVESTRAVAGWVRIGKKDNSYYVALSDGTYYIVDKGTENNVPFSSITSKDVVKTGNGNNYQYYNGVIYGSDTDGQGWGIGDYVNMTDGDDTNNGKYMSNGPKDGGYTPYCTIAAE